MGKRLDLTVRPVTVKARSWTFTFLTGMYFKHRPTLSGTGRSPWTGVSHMLLAYLPASQRDTHRICSRHSRLKWNQPHAPLCPNTPLTSSWS